MRWFGRRESGNVEDRRRFGGRGVAIGGGASILLLIVALIAGVDPGQWLGGGGEAPGAHGGTTAAEDELAQFVSVVLADTEDVWHEQFRRLGERYREPRLVLFAGQVESACGFASAAVGPFYCPEDDTIYIDLSFYHDLRARFGAPGDFAQAYVIAHEVGHHVQRLMGIMDRVHAQRGRMSEAEANRLSVRLELQADFLAGVWAHHAQRRSDILEPGDLEEALKAAEAIGDDRLQMRGRGYVVPESFTHGTSEQRLRWFKLGFESGDLARMREIFERPYERL